MAQGARLQSVTAETSRWQELEAARQEHVCRLAQVSVSSVQGPTHDAVLPTFRVGFLISRTAAKKVSQGQPNQDFLGWWPTPLIPAEREAERFL